MRVLSSHDVRLALPMAEAIGAMKRAFAALSAGQATIPLRAHLDVPRYEGVSLIMPGYVDDAERPALAVKVVSLFGGNLARGLARIQAAVLVLEPDTGRPLALLEGATLTAIRTGAASGAATDLLARPESRVAAIFGCGVQARTQLEAVCHVRPLETIWIYAPTAAHVERMIQEVRGQGPIPDDVRPAADPRQAVADADIICTATTSAEPVFDDADLKPGAHINAVGSYQPHVREIPAETVIRGLVVVDHVPSALAETGDLIQPMQAGVWGPGQIHAELGDVVLGLRPGRSHDQQLTLFKSVGNAAQDAVAAQVALRRAAELNLGQSVAW